MRMSADALRELIEVMKSYTAMDKRLSVEYSVDATPIYAREDEPLDGSHANWSWMDMNAHKTVEDIYKKVIASARCESLASQLDLPNVAVSFDDMLDMMDGRDNKSRSEDKK